jgi:flagellar basal body-associated protein FliL
VANGDPILRGQDENAPFRALNRVILVVALVVVVVGAAAYALWSALN